MDAASGGATQMGGPKPAAKPPGMAHGGEVSYASGGPVSEFGRMLANSGGMVPGQASVPGDSLKNDTVNAKLSPGEIVIPRSIAQAPNAAELAAQFVAAVRAKHGRGL